MIESIHLCRWNSLQKCCLQNEQSNEITKFESYSEI
jgi:hypothetical protein